MSAPRILVVRLGAMGDILHALPAAVTLRSAWPEAHLSWAVHPKWRDLLEGSGVADETIPVDRGSLGGIIRAWRGLRSRRFDVAVDFQGLTQSALVATIARAARVYGFDTTQVREKAAALFYTEHVHAESRHVVDRNLELAAAAGAIRRCYGFPLPPGRPEGRLPSGPFVLASPFAGWVSKQWPLENYSPLAQLLRREYGVPLVLNGAPWQETQLRRVEGAVVHVSSVAGLIDATRRASLILGVDSGPVHLAAALDKPGVAIFGPTDPARNGPYSPRLTILRSAGVDTTYERAREIHPAMRAIGPEQVLEALRPHLRGIAAQERPA